MYVSIWRIKIYNKKGSCFVEVIEKFVYVGCEILFKSKDFRMSNISYEVILIF